MTIQRRLLALLAAAALTLLSFVTTTPAQAHDGITATSPTDGATVSAGAFEVSVTASEDIMAMADMATNQIFVFGPLDTQDAATVSLGCIKISGATASVPVDIDKPGDYQVTWALVSQDGHPQEGTFGFTVTNDSDYVATGNTDFPADCAALPMLVATPYEAGATPEARDIATTEAASEDDGQWIGLLVGSGFVVVGSLAGVTVVALREKAKRDKELLKKLAETDPEI
jgi:methionine-rich copper-binding protein CopC